MPIGAGREADWGVGLVPAFALSGLSRDWNTSWSGDVGMMLTGVRKLLKTHGFPDDEREGPLFLGVLPTFYVEGHRLREIDC